MRTTKHLRRLISAFVIRYSSFYFSTKKRLTNLNGEQNDTGNLLVSHRICHFRAIQPFDLLWQKWQKMYQVHPVPIIDFIRTEIKVIIAYHVYFSNTMDIISGNDIHFVAHKIMTDA